jgi:hypothetical protein
VPGLTADDDDVAVFVPTSLGEDTAGSFLLDMPLDGSSLALDANDVTAVEVHDLDRTEAAGRRWCLASPLHNQRSPSRSGCQVGPADTSP